MRKRIIQKIFLIICSSSLNMIFSQSNQYYYHKNPSPIDEGTSIEISQLIFMSKTIQTGVLFFRDKGEISYQEVEMALEGGKWFGIIPGDRVTSKGIEYVTILTTLEGGRIALPLVEDPFSEPLEIDIIPRNINKP